MVSFIERRRNELIDLCRKFKVKRLELFGSATGKLFDPAKSDIDFLVEFEAIAPEDHAACYFGLLSALQELFDKKIDLVEIKAIRNPYFKKGIESSRMPVYGK
jgi:predicted nucleotidyltransferase